MNFVTFNQDYSYLAVGEFSFTYCCALYKHVVDIHPATPKGFRIFTTDPFAKSYETKEGNIAVIEMLFSTSLVALILSPRRLQITNTKVRLTLTSQTTLCIQGLTADLIMMYSANAQYVN